MWEYGGSASSALVKTGRRMDGAHAGHLHWRDRRRRSGRGTGTLILDNRNKEINTTQYVPSWRRAERRRSGIKCLWRGFADSRCPGYTDQKHRAAYFGLSTGSSTAVQVVWANATGPNGPPDTTTATGPGRTQSVRGGASGCRKRWRGPTPPGRTPSCKRQGGDGHRHGGGVVLNGAMDTNASVGYLPGGRTDDKRDGRENGFEERRRGTGLHINWQTS